MINIETIAIAVPTDIPTATPTPKDESGFVVSNLLDKVCQRRTAKCNSRFIRDYH